jgi:hypothetical protein
MPILTGNLDPFPTARAWGPAKIAKSNLAVSGTAKRNYVPLNRSIKTL